MLVAYSLQRLKCITEQSRLIYRQMLLGDFYASNLSRLCVAAFMQLPSPVLHLGLCESSFYGSSTLSSTRLIPEVAIFTISKTNGRLVKKPDARLSVVQCNKSIVQQQFDMSRNSDKNASGILIKQGCKLLKLHTWDERDQ